MNKSISNKTSLVIIVGVCVYFYIISKLCEPIFSTCDDAIFRDIISGNYTGQPDAHAIFVAYPLSFIISRLYMVNGSIEWYGLIWSLLVIISACLVLTVLSQILNSRVTKVLFGGFVLVCIFTPIFLVQQFTVLAGVLCGTATFLVLLDKKYVPVILFIIAYNVRKEVFYIAIPIVCFFIIWLNYKRLLNKEYKKALFNIGYYILVLTMISGIGMGCQKIAYSSNQWKDYKKNDTARFKLYDYYDLDSKRNQSIIESLKLPKDKEYLIKTCRLYLDGNITYSDLNRVRKELKKERYKNINGIKILIKLIKMNIKDYWYFNIIIWGMIIYIFFVVRSKKHIFLLAAELAREMAYFYLLYIGRLPERVYVGIALIPLLGLLAISSEAKGPKNKTIYSVASITAIVLCTYGICCAQINHRHYMISHYQADNEKVISFCKKNKSNYYFIDMPTNQYVLKNKNEADNVCIISLYLNKSPLMNRFTYDLGHRDLSETLLKEQKYRLITAEKNFQDLKKYFDYKYSYSCIKVVERIKCSGNNKYVVLKIEKNEMCFPLWQTVLGNMKG